MRISSLAADAAAVVLGVAQVLRRRVGERRSGANKTWQRSAARLIHDVAQPCLGCALRVVAGRGSPSVGPGGPDLLLHLTPSGSRYFAYQTGPRVRSARKTCPLGSLSAPIAADPTHVLGHIGDMFENHRTAAHMKKPGRAGLSRVPPQGIEP